MCLISKRKTPMIAKEDIVCYKSVIYDADLDLGFVTPYRHVVIPDDVVYGKRNFVAKEDDTPDRRKRKGEFKEYRIEKGYIHTWGDFNYARNHALVFRFCGEVLYECVIPKGTEYYEGTFDGIDGTKSFCAKEIRFVRRLDLQ